MKTAKLLFSGKIPHRDKETNNLVENNTVLSDDQVFADNIVLSLAKFSLNKKNFHENETNSCNLNLLGPNEAAISKHNNHPRVKLESTIFYQFFIFSPNDSPFKNYEKYFLFHLKSSFRSRDIQIFVIFPFLSRLSRFKRTRELE